jgi:hypothetical protein
MTPLAALKLAIQHIDHMAAWITAQRAGYSFESLGEDMPGIREAATSPTPTSGAPTEQHPDAPYCKPDQSCCDFICGN